MKTRERWGFFLFMTGIVVVITGVFLLGLGGWSALVLPAGMIIAAGGYAIGTDQL